MDGLGRDGRTHPMSHQRVVSGRHTPMTRHSDKPAGSQLAEYERRAIRTRGHDHLRTRKTTPRICTDCHGMYKRLINMPQHAWEGHREVASQAGGHLPGLFWPSMTGGELEGTPHMDEIASIHTPQQAAARLKVHHAVRGGGAPFLKSLKKLMDITHMHAANLIKARHATLHPQGDKTTNL